MVQGGRRDQGAENGPRRLVLRPRDSERPDFEVPDALKDPRFAGNPLVTGTPGVRFYAGHPLTTLDGYRIGSFCIIDHAPRRLTEEERAMLRDLAAIVESELNFITIDHARRKAAEARKKLRELSVFQQAILDGAGCSIVSTDEKGTILSMNRTAECWLGWSEREVVGKQSPVLFHDEAELALRAGEPASGSPETPFDVLAGPARAGAVEEREWSLVRKDKTRFPALLSITTLRNDLGGISGFVLVGRDITAQKAADRKTHELVCQLESANEAKAAFIANTSHEIRTPMNGVIGMAELLAHTDLSPDQRDYVEGIRRCGDSLLAIINDILDLSKIEAGKMSLESIPYDLHRLAELTVEMLALGAEQKGLSVDLHIAEDVPVFIKGDSVRLRQVLTNLIGNAVKFTDSGSVTIRAALVPDDGSRLRFEVEDTGIGIPPEAQAALFKPFIQADSATTRRFGGTGLGLSISMQLIHLMSGEIGLTSAPGKGSTFWFEIPLLRASPPPEALKQGQLNGYRALILDRGRQSYFADHLAAIGCEPVVAGSAEELLERLKASKGGPPFQFCAFMGCDDAGETLALVREIQVFQKKTSYPRQAFIFAADDPAMRRDLRELQAAGLGSVLSRPMGRTQIRSVLTRLSKKVPPPAKPAGAPAPVPPRRLRILVAEDNVLNQKVAIGMLNILGHSPDIASNGKEAVEAVGRCPYDLVLMDCQMPRMDGYAATRAIRQLRPDDGGRSRLPIVALSAHVTAAIREKCLEAGMDGCVSKPLQLPALQEVLARHTGGGAAPGIPPESESGETPPMVVNPAQFNELRELQEMGEPGLLRDLLRMFFEKTPAAAEGVVEAIRAATAPPFARRPTAWPDCAPALARIKWSGSAGRWRIAPRPAISPSPNRSARNFSKPSRRFRHFCAGSLRSLKKKGPDRPRPAAAVGSDQAVSGWVLRN